MSKKKQSEETTMSILEWCNDMVAKGHQLSLVWDGGNDSGAVYFKIDDKEVGDEND